MPQNAHAADSAPQGRTPAAPFFHCREVLRSIPYCPTPSWHLQGCRGSWNCGSQTDPAAQITLPYVLDGVTYNFISSRPLNVTSLGWAYNRGDGLYNPKQCYLGFPVVEGYALTTVHYTLGANNGANYMITGAIAEGTADPVPVGGGETQSDSSATEFTFNLTDTAPGTQYWIKVWSKPSIMTSMTLTYSK